MCLPVPPKYSIITLPSAVHPLLVPVTFKPYTSSQAVLQKVARGGIAIFNHSLSVLVYVGGGPN